MSGQLTIQVVVTPGLMEAGSADEARSRCDALEKLLRIRYSQWSITVHLSDQLADKTPMVTYGTGQQPTRNGTNDLTSIIRDEVLRTINGIVIGAYGGHQW